LAGPTLKQQAEDQQYNSLLLSKIGEMFKFNNKPSSFVPKNSPQEIVNTSKIKPSINMSFGTKHDDRDKIRSSNG